MERINIPYKTIVDRGSVFLDSLAEGMYILSILAKDEPDYDGYQDVHIASIEISHRELGEFITKLQEVYDHA